MISETFSGQKHVMYPACYAHCGLIDPWLAGVLRIGDWDGLMLEAAE